MAVCPQCLVLIFPECPSLGVEGHTILPPMSTYMKCTFTSLLPHLLLKTLSSFAAFSLPSIFLLHASPSLLSLCSENFKTAEATMLMAVVEGGRSGARRVQWKSGTINCV